MHRRSVRSLRSGAVMACSPRRRGRDGFGSAADDLVDDGLVRLVARLHRDVGLGIDRFALPAASLLDAFLSSGRSPRRLVRLSSTSRSAFSQTEMPLARISVAGLRVHEGAAAGRQHLRPARRAGARSRAPRRRGNRARRAWRRSPGWSCRRPSRSRCRHRRRAMPSRAASRRPIDDLPAPIMPTSTTERRPERAHDRRGFDAVPFSVGF